MAPVESEIQKELFDKILKNDVNSVRNILTSNDLKTDIYDENGMTPLWQAAYRGNKDIVRLLLDQGANVNSGKHEYDYTALHFAALSGNHEICQLLLENGAKTHATNSVGRTPSQMAAFVGNHACVAVINNFVPKSDIDYYTTPTGLETEPKLPPHLSDALHKFVMQVNLSPVKIAMNLQKSPLLFDNIDKVRHVLELMSQREMKRGIESNEIMSFKFHYLGCILADISKCKKFKPSQSSKKRGEDGEVKKIDPIEVFIRKMLNVSKGPSPELQESFLRDCIRQFPHMECTIFRQMVSTLAMSDSPRAISVITSAINGQRGFMDSENICATCSEEKAVKKCSKCRSAQYCDRDCQKLHWFVHKRYCDAPPAPSATEDDEKSRLEAAKAATQALVSGMQSMNVK